MPPSKPETPSVAADTAAEVKTGAVKVTAPKGPPGMVPVRLTICPDADHWAYPGELPHLRNEGLLIEDETAEPEGDR